MENLVTAVQGEKDATAQLNDFVDRAAHQHRRLGPVELGVLRLRRRGVGRPRLIAVGAVLVAGGAGAYTLVRRNRRRRAEEQRAALEKLRVVVDEDITAFGEELDRLDFHPAEAGADDAMRADYERALDAYEQAKSLMAGATQPEDVRGGHPGPGGRPLLPRQLAARREGRPLPERRPPCFFDPRHGPSVADATWTPPAARPREVPGLRAPTPTRLADGRGPR